MGRLLINDLEGQIDMLASFVERVRLINDSYFKLRDSTTRAWFRGQANSEWTLTPRLYRGDHWPELEREMNRDFRLFATSKLDHLPADEVEWLFIMQHYGAPTRLLDWTESYLFALFFAVEDDSVTADGAVWVLHPWALNSRTLDVERVPLASDSVLDRYRLGDPAQVKRHAEARYPAAIRPIRATERILAQRGAFTLHGHREAGLWRVPGRKECLVKIPVVGGAKQSLRRELLSAGIGRVTLFPDLSGLGVEIGYRYSKDCIQSLS